ncbi:MULTISPECIES: sulfur carrier protein ThiS [Bacteroides]|uniref:sulfur carrier protein ThiS n=1 Tax=Bacteroides TaxID=816 RepID=UPI001DD9C85A|nr:MULTISPECIES: sulfur carrier protein ThiS [Bacteroides]HJD91469.1 sulfur carrier protein ThiS [Bacteroides coprosuis]
MIVIINDKPYEVKENSSVADLAKQLALPAQGVAVALHSHVIPRHIWHRTMLEENAELLILQAVSGG